jgi:3-dehydroquinate dehydratase / shikimate dehydrogenase
MSEICLTLAEEDLTVLNRKVARYAERLSFIEIRLDFLASSGLPSIPATDTRFIATCRPVREGGNWQGTEEERLERLRKAARSGFHWVDIEHDVGVRSEDFPGCLLLRSRHDFTRIPRDMIGLVRALEALPGDAVKWAVAVRGSAECIRLLSFMESLPKTKPRVILGMGEHGRISRLLGSLLGNLWTYVAEDGGKAVAPGQFSLDEATACYRLDRWKTTPELYGVLGNPVGDSRSCHLHNGLFRHYGHERLCLPIQLEDLDSWFDYVRRTRLPFCGFGVTFPFKREAGRYVRPPHGSTEAVNTLCLREGGWSGLNTDRSGFLRPLQARLPNLEGKRAVVLGYGGVAETVVPTLQAAGMEVLVVGRRPERLRDFARRHDIHWVLMSDFRGEAELCVNATPIGQLPLRHLCPLAPEQINFSLVYDLVYNPARTRLLVLAERRGAQTISGCEMFIEQAAEQFFAWTGTDPDRGVMRRLMAWDAGGSGEV